MFPTNTDALSKTIETSEKLLTEQLALIEKTHSQLREQTDAAVRLSLGTAKIGIDMMIAAQKATLSAFAPAAEQ